LRIFYGILAGWNFGMAAVFVARGEYRLALTRLLILTLAIQVAYLWPEKKSE
jgi:hypothetical protein